MPRANEHTDIDDITAAEEKHPLVRGWG